MNQQLWFENLAAYSLQVALLIIAGTALVYAFRLRAPGVLLPFWQILLAACLLLPVLQPWRRPAQSAPFLPVLEAGPEPIPPAPQSAAAPVRSVPFPRFAVIGAILAAGVGARFFWLGIGLLRLRRYRNRSRRAATFPEPIREMQWRVGVAPEILFSPEVHTPVTFGWRQPAIIFPEFFTDMGESLQRPIACHELLHVRRNDWLFIVVEEILRSLFWFHPAVWWALGRIHLSREQLVDHEVLRVTGERQPYLESLLHIASRRGRPAAVPAPLLLREHHLVQRVTLMLKETTMTRKRLIVSLVSIGAFLLWTGTFAAGWFPLTAPAAPAAPAAIQAAPQAADPTFMISYRDADVRNVITQIAKQLGIDPIDVDPQLQGSVSLTGRFTKAELMDAFTQILRDKKARLINAGNGYKVVPEAEHFVKPAIQPPQAAHREPVRVGGNVQQSKLIYKVDPVYPELAFRARVSGTVILTVTLDEQGNVTDVKVLKGHPLLDDAAIEAVRQWRYSPTYLNGEAVPVQATVTVPFIYSMTSLVSDRQGNLIASTGVSLKTVLDDAMANRKTIVITIPPQVEVPFDVLEQTMRNLYDQGITNLQVSGGGYVFKAGRLYYGPDAVVGGARSYGVRAPEFDLDMSALAATAKASGAVTEMQTPYGSISTVSYMVYVTQTGEITGVDRMGQGIPEVESALRQMRVLSPGRLGDNAVPTAVLIRVPVK